MIVPVEIVKRATAQIKTALTPLGIQVYRSRAKALNEDTARAVVVQLGAANGERYAVDGSTDWRVQLKLVCVGRALEQDDGETADDVAGEVLEAAHGALMANPGLGLPGLDWNNGFSMSEDDETFDEEITALVALYEYQICTQGTSASAP